MTQPNKEYQIRLPCGPGSKMYAFCECFGILEYTVDHIVINTDTITYQCSAHSKPIGDCPSECLDEIEVDSKDVGKTIFLTYDDVKIPDYRNQYAACNKGETS